MRKTTSELRDAIQEETGSPAQGQQDTVSDIISTDSVWEVTWGLICATLSGSVASLTLIIIKKKDII